MTDKVREILSRYGETDDSNLWTVQKSTIIKHACLERVAAKAGIKYLPPSILRAERDEAVILVTGELEARTEWSIGEAKVVPMIDTGKKNQWGKPIYEPEDGAIGNYQISPKQAAYVYAMAEKRAKDRVILKLIGLHGLAYSEDEADDFKESAPQAKAEPERSSSSLSGEDNGNRSQARLDESSDKRIADTLIIAMGKADTLSELEVWGRDENTQAAIKDLDIHHAQRVRDAYGRRKAILPQPITAAG